MRDILCRRKSSGLMIDVRVGICEQYGVTATDDLPKALRVLNDMLPPHVAPVTIDEVVTDG